ncbi:MAG: hypothetical protein IJT79_01400 [Ruminococcus sp.]|nr:hypothetical protein [Ruminococcus sp.]MBQ7503961.1 hypothetical protein [Ruminococcus sp.]
MKQKQNGIYFTVTDREKRRISKNADLCGLKQGEYIRQRALGYAPKAVPPDAFFHFCEEIDRLCEQPFSTEVNQKALSLLAEIEKLLIRPEKEDIISGTPRSLLRGEKEHPRSDNPITDSSVIDMSGV